MSNAVAELVLSHCYALIREKEGKTLYGGVSLLPPESFRRGSSMLSDRASRMHQDAASIRP